MVARCRDAARPVLLVNPAARGLAHNAWLLDTIRAVAGDEAEVIAPHALPELEAAAASILDRGAQAVMLIGGDGTVMTALSALERARGQRPLPMIAVAHAGTVGTVTRRLGSPRALFGAIRAFCSGAPRTRSEQPTLRAVTEQNVSRIGFIFGAGMVARFFEKYDAAGAGVPAAAGIAARVFAGALLQTSYALEVLSPTPCRVSMDGQLLKPTAWGVIVASVLDDVGLHVRITYRGGEDPERPHVVASPLGPRQLALNFPRVLAGLGVHSPGTFDGLVPRFRLDFGESPGSWIFDGDTVRSRAVEVSAGPVLHVVRMR